MTETGPFVPLLSIGAEKDAKAAIRDLERGRRGYLVAGHPRRWFRTMTAKDRSTEDGS
jgi:hypothetical protein